MADEALAGSLVIGGHRPLLHPGLEGLSQPGHRQRLEGAVLHIQNVMAPGTEVTNGQAVLSLGHGQLYLVAVAQRVLRPQHRGQLQVKSSQPPQSVVYPVPLGGELLLVGHVAVLAAPALAADGAVGFHTSGGGGEQLDTAAPGNVLLYL